MKYKVLNSAFFKAWYSFSSLSMYYRHVVAQLRYSSDQLKEAGREVEEDCKKKGREFDKQGQEKFERIYAEIWPGFFHNSFLISACSQFEHEAKKLCAIIQEEHKMPIAWDDMQGPVPSKTKRFLRFAGVTLKDDSLTVVLQPSSFIPTEVYDENRAIISALWKELDYYYRVRNCIVHDNCVIRKARGSDKLQAYATDNGILVERDGQLEIQLNENFNVTVCNTMGKFFDKLMGAYYSTPLP